MPSGVPVKLPADNAALVKKLNWKSRNELTEQGYLESPTSPPPENIAQAYDAEVVGSTDDAPMVEVTGLAAMKPWDDDRAAKQLQPYAPEVLRVIGEGAKKGRRTELNMFCAIMKWNASVASIAAHIMTTYGVSDPAEAKRLIANARSAEGDSLEAVFENACTFIDGECRKRGITLTFPK